MRTLDEKIRLSLASDAHNPGAEPALAALRYQDTIRVTLDYLNRMELESATAMAFAVAIRRLIGSALGITEEGTA